MIKENRFILIFAFLFFLPQFKFIKTFSLKHYIQSFNALLPYKGYKSRDPVKKEKVSTISLKSPKGGGLSWKKKQPPMPLMPSHLKIGSFSSVWVYLSFPSPLFSFSYSGFWYLLLKTRVSLPAFKSIVSIRCYNNIWEKVKHIIINLLDVFHARVIWWSSTEFWVNRNHLRILTDPDNAVAWIISIRPPISTGSNHLSKFSGPFQAH